MTGLCPDCKHYTDGKCSQPWQAVKVAELTAREARMQECVDELKQPQYWEAK